MEFDSMQSATVGASNESRLQKVLETAEHFIALSGLEGASMRQISAAAGYANSNTVQYHFGDKYSLVDAILEWRCAEQEDRRAVLLHQLLQRTAHPGAAELLKVIINPILEVRDDEGRRIHAHLLLKIMYLNRFANKEVWQISTPATLESIRLLHGYAPHLHMDLFRTRVSRISAMILQLVVNNDFAKLDGIATPPEEIMLEDAYSVALAGLQAVVPVATEMWFSRYRRAKG
jgi:TetR/AcrR family transcriptional regulator, regulator of cefoperazone and chloramphenicol sensitivity